MCSYNNAPALRRRCVILLLSYSSHRRRDAFIMAAYDKSFNTDVSKTPFERAGEFTKYVENRADYKVRRLPQ